MPEAKAFASQFVSTQHRDETAELGMWVFIATEILLFGGLILGYFVYRHAFPAAFAAASRHTEIVIGAANTTILLTSSFLVACAVDAFSGGDTKTLRHVTVRCHPAGIGVHNFKGD